jgi:hypothetical protein
MAMRHAFWILAGGFSVVLCGCDSHGPRTVDNPDLEAKVPAIEDAAKTHDRAAIPQLVKDLESDDPAVRFYAIRGLRSLTGETFGYRYYDSDDDRHPALVRWQQWLARQTQP